MDGRIVYAKTAAEQLVGQPAGGLLGPQITCFVHADGAPQVRRRLLLAGRARRAELAGLFETTRCRAG